MQLTPPIQNALSLMQDTRQHIFITGKAGTGKSTLLRYFLHHTLKKVVTLASTGVAALNVEGQTIHSFFKLPFKMIPDEIAAIKYKKDKKALIESLDTIIIDEASMLRADILDYIDYLLKKIRKSKLAFGGVQMIFFGDLMQLPPIVEAESKAFFDSFYVAPYFYAAQIMKDIDLQYIELDQVFRQQDEKFINVLNQIRDGKPTEADLDLINSRVNPEFEPSANEYYVYLTTTNKKADYINKYRLSQLGTDSIIFAGFMQGSVPKSMYPSGDLLELKVGAQVMILINKVKVDLVTGDEDGFEYVNGTIGRVEAINIPAAYHVSQEGIIQIGQPTPDGTPKPTIVIRTDEGQKITLAPYEYKIFEFEFQLSSGLIKKKEIGTFIQFPIKLAWANTIHKAQGKTFNNLIIDFESYVFEKGQAYVALSRGVALEQIVLTRPLRMSDIKIDERISEFIGRFK